MTDITNTQELAGKKLIDRNGADIGEVEAIYLDRETDQAEFALVKTGMLGRKSTLVPLTGADVDDVRVWVDLDKESVKDAPTFDPSAEISSQQEQEVFRHYGLEPPQSTTPAAPPPTSSAHETGGGADPRSPQHSETQTAGTAASVNPAHDTRPEAARAGDERAAPAQPASEPGEGHATEPQRAGDDGMQPRLRRYTVTDEVEVKVPIQREEVRVEDPQREAAEGHRGHEASVDDQGRDPVEGHRPEQVDDQRQRPTEAPPSGAVDDQRQQPAQAPPREPVPQDPGVQR